MINQTPWSSYITIRRKFVDPKKAAVLGLSAGNASCNFLENNEKLVEQNLQITMKNKTLENELVALEEEVKNAEVRNKEVIETLHAKLVQIETENKSIQSELNKKVKDIKALEKENVVKDQLILNINTGFNTKVKDLEKEVEGLREFQTRKLKQEKEAFMKKKKALKKKKQKSKKEESQALEAIEHLEAGKNHNVVDDVQVKEEIHPCPVCDFVANLRSETEKHVLKEHSDQVEQVSKKFLEYNSESLKMLENISESEYILTPEEITHSGVDWKIHLEILEILDQNQKRKS